MRTMLLSIKPEVYEKICAGTKIFEHRRSFPDEPIKAYMYVSAPTCAIKGILFLGKRHSLCDWEKEYSFDEEAVKRIQEYEKQYRFAMEISEFQETTSVELNVLRKDLSKFVVPQMYYYLDGTELLDYIESNIQTTGNKVMHSFDTIQASQLCQN